MNFSKLKAELMKAAKALGVCKDSYAKMRGYDRDELINMYLHLPDWCLERNFPSLEMLRREFSDIKDKGVFVDKTFDGELFKNKPIYVFHNCKGVINVDWNVEKAIIPILYFANDCEIEVYSNDKITVFKPTKINIIVYGENTSVIAHDGKYIKFELSNPSKA